MKKTISISLASTPFTIEEDAYQALDSYLSGIKAHFANTTEVVADIEARIAEQFLESGKKIITQKEVATVIASMGSANEFGGEAKGEQKSTAESTNKRKLYRNPNDKIIAGVASGIAAYLGVEVVWVRFAFVFFSLINGFGVLVYIAFWIAMPEAKSASQILEMSGTPVTLETLSDRVKERVEEVKKDKGILQRIFFVPLFIIGGIIKIIVTKIFPVLTKVFGAVISLTSAFMLLGLSVGLGFALFNFSQNLFDFPVYTIAPTPIIILFIFAVYFALFVPILFVSFLGTALVVGKSTIRGNTALTLLGFWFVALLTGGIIAANYSARVAEYVSTAPEYQQISQSVPSLSPFTTIEARNGVHVEYVQGATSTVVLVGREKDIDHVVVTSVGGVLHVETATKNEKRSCIFCDYKVPTIIVTAPMIDTFDGQNGVNFETNNFSTPGTLTIKLSNGAHGVFGINKGNIDADVMNGVLLELTGTITDVKLTGQNGVKIDATDLSADTADVSIANAGEIEIGATKTLTASARNGAKVVYAGTPVLTKDVGNGSSVESVDTVTE